jgi:DNA replication and repair protein RecF
MELLSFNKISIENFRNIENILIELGPKINCIFGDNGQGKTNILEAIYYLNYRKSFRKNTQFDQLINRNNDLPSFEIKATYQTGSRESFISGQFEGRLKKIYLNNSPLKGRTGFDCFFINPFDSFLFHQSSQYRRQWMDQFLVKTHHEYNALIKSLEKVLRNRNVLLMKIGQYTKNLKNEDYKQLEIFNSMLVDYSQKIGLIRDVFVEKLNTYCSTIMKEIFNDNADLRFEYLPSFPLANAKLHSEQLIENFNSDLRNKTTKIGPHRDDFYFLLNNANTTECGSTGQQKMSYLSLVFSQLEVYREDKGSYPVVLIDDISGELDGLRWKNLINYLEKKTYQVIITTANEAFKRELKSLSEVKLLQVHSGELI